MESMFSAAQGFLLWKKIKSSQFLWACQLGAFTHVQLSEHLWIYWCYWISTLSNTHVRIWWNQCGGMVASHCHSWSRWWCDVIFFDELSQGFMTALPNTFSVFCFFCSGFKFAWSLMYFQEVFSCNHIDMFSMIPCYWYELQLWWSSSGAPEQFLVGKTCSSLSIAGCCCKDEGEYLVLQQTVVWFFSFSWYTRLEEMIGKDLLNGVSTVVFK